MTKTDKNLKASGGTGRRTPDIKTFSSLSNSTFRLYIIGMIGQWASMNMGMLVRSQLVYEITDSGFVLGLTALANAIPMILLSLWGGAIADRVHKKYILLFSMIVSLLISAGVGLCITLGYLGEANPNSWWIVVAASLGQGAVMGIMMPARQSIIAEIVPPEQLMNAISLNMMGMNTFRILAPAASGFLVEGLGFAPVYYIMASMYLIGVFCMIIIPKTATKLSQGRSALRDIIDGFTYIKKEKTMLHILIFTVIGMLCGMPFMQLMPMITNDILDVGPSGQGILMTVSGIGAIVGSLILASIPSRRRGTIMIITGGIMATALIGFGFSSIWWFSILSVIFVGLGQTGYRTTGNALVQAYTEPEYRGRVMSFMMMGIGFSSMGTFFAGIMSEAIGIQWSISGLAMVFLAAAILYVILSQRLRKLD